MKEYETEMLEVGDSICIKKEINAKEINAFADVTGDYNSIHIDDVKAKKSIFGKKVAHGMYGASLISAVIGTKLPGEGTIYLEQQLMFVKPIFVGDSVTIFVKVEEIMPKEKAWLCTQIYNQDNVICIDGRALVKLPRKEQ